MSGEENIVRQAVQGWMQALNQVGAPHYVAWWGSGWSVAKDWTTPSNPSAVAGTYDTPSGTQLMSALRRSIAEAHRAPTRPVLVVFVSDGTVSMHGAMELAAAAAEEGIHFLSVGFDLNDFASAVWRGEVDEACRLLSPQGGAEEMKQNVKFIEDRYGLKGMPNPVVYQGGALGPQVARDMLARVKRVMGGGSTRRVR